MKTQRTSLAVIGMLVIGALAAAPGVAAAAVPAVSKIEFTNSAFSPNNDGSKDTTTLTVTLSSAYTGSLYANVYNGTTLVRTGIPLSGAGLVWSAVWDGQDDVGNVVAAATYTVKVSGDNYGGDSEASTPTGAVAVDLTAPTGLSILIQGTDSGNQLTNSTTVSLTLAASGASQMSFRELASGSCPTDGTGFSTPETFATSRQFTLTATEGSKTICYRARDEAGNIASPVSASIILDTTSPTEGRVLIENNTRETTGSLTVNLTVQGTGAASMRFSNDGGTTWSSYQAFVTSVSGYTLASAGSATKTVSVQLKDAAGNVATGTGDTITLDQTPPTITVSPTSNGVTSTAANVVWQTGEEGYSRITWVTNTSLSGGTSWSTSKTTAHNVSLASLVPGTRYTYTAWVKDEAGNLNSSEGIFNTTSTVSNFPSGLGIALNGGAAHATSGEVTVTLTAVEATHYALSNNGATWSEWAPFTTSVTWSLLTGAGAQTTEDGARTVHFRAKNGLGNASVTPTASIILDRSNATASGVGVTATGTTLTISWTSSENATGKVHYGTSANALTSTSSVTSLGTSHSVTLTGLTPGTTYSYQINMTDVAGNTGLDGTVRTAATASTPPTGLTATLSGVTGSLTANPEVALVLAATGATNMSFSNDNATFSTPEQFRTTKTWNVTNAQYGGTSADGVKTIYVKATNPAGSTVREVQVTLDRTAPAVTGPATATLAWAATSPSIAVNATDAVGLASLLYKVTSGPAETGNTRVDWTAIAAVSGTATSQSFQVPAASFSQGLNYVSIRATDTAGNVATLRDAAVVRYDTTSPTSSMTVLAAYSANPVNLSWSGSDAHSGGLVYALQVKRGAGDWETLGSGWTNTTASLTLDDAVAYAFRVLATDAAGNVHTPSAAQTTTTVDLSAPTAPVLGVTAGTLSATLTWTAATDTSGVSAYQVLHATSPTGTFSQVGSVAGSLLTYNAIGLEAGSHSFKVRAVDAFGRATESSVQTVTVTAPPTTGGDTGGDTGGSTAPADTVAPRVTSYGPVGEIDSVRPTLEANYSDNVGVVVGSVALTLDGQLVTPVKTATRLSYTPSADLAYGTHTARVAVADATGRLATQEWTFIIRAPAPDPVEEGEGNETDDGTDPELPAPEAKLVLSGLLVADATGRPVAALKAGDRVVVTAALVNEGDAEGTLDVSLLVNGEVVKTEPVTLAPAGVRAVSFEHVLSTAGTYTVTLNDLPAATLVVAAADPKPGTGTGADSTPGTGPVPSTDEPTTKSEPKGGIPGFEMVAALGAVAAALVLLGRRRSG